METLHCQSGDHDWKRPLGAGGRKPHNCPEHKAGAGAKRKPKASHPPPRQARIPRRGKRASPAEEHDELLTAREKYAAWKAQSAELLEGLVRERGALAMKLSDFDVAIAELGGEPSPSPAKLRTVPPKPRADLCKHAVPRDQCSLCAERRQRIDEAATSRPGAGDAD